MPGEQTHPLLRRQLSLLSGSHPTLPPHPQNNRWPLSHKGGAVEAAVDAVVGEGEAKIVVAEEEILVEEIIVTRQIQIPHLIIKVINADPNIPTYQP